MADHRNAQVLRGLPFQAPEESAARGSRLKGWAIIFGGATGLLLVLLVAAIVVIVNLSNRPITPAQAVTLPEKPITNTLREVKQPTPPVATVKKLTPQDRFMKALGGMTAAHLYQSYLNVGLLADGVESEAYTVADAQKMLSVVLTLMNMVDHQLNDVTNINLSVEDQAALEDIRGLSVQLRSQANALQSFWETGDREQLGRYHQVRERAWDSLCGVLGLQ